MLFYHQQRKAYNIPALRGLCPVHTFTDIAKIGFGQCHGQSITYCREGNIVLSDVLDRGFVLEVEFWVCAKPPKCCQMTPDWTLRAEISF